VRAGGWQVAANVKPSLVIFVMDGSIGQAAFDQAKAFKDAVEARAPCRAARAVRACVCTEAHGAPAPCKRSAA